MKERQRKNHLQGTFLEILAIILVFSVAVYFLKPWLPGRQQHKQSLAPSKSHQHTSLVSE